VNRGGAETDKSKRGPALTCQQSVSESWQFLKKHFFSCVRLRPRGARRARDSISSSCDFPHASKLALAADSQQCECVVLRGELTRRRRRAVEIPHYKRH